MQGNNNNAQMSEEARRPGREWGGGGSVGVWSGLIEGIKFNEMREKKKKKLGDDEKMIQLVGTEWWKKGRLPKTTQVEKVRMERVIKNWSWQLSGKEGMRMNVQW
jgi:hypothetical protein